MATNNLSKMSPLDYATDWAEALGEYKALQADVQICHMARNSLLPALPTEVPPQKLDMALGLWLQDRYPAAFEWPDVYPACVTAAVEAAIAAGSWGTFIDGISPYVGQPLPNSRDKPAILEYVARGPKTASETRSVRLAVPPGYEQFVLNVHVATSGADFKAQTLKLFKAQIEPILRTHVERPIEAKTGSKGEPISQVRLFNHWLNFCGTLPPLIAWDDLVVRKDFIGRVCRRKEGPRIHAADIWPDDKPPTASKVTSMLKSALRWLPSQPKESLQVYLAGVLAAYMDALGLDAAAYVKLDI
jgi:hypothetical protein